MSDDILKRTLCVEFAELPEVDEAWLEGKARDIGKSIVGRLGEKLEWGQVVTLPKRNGIGLALLFARGHEHDLTIAETIFETVAEHVGIDLSKSGKTRPEDGLPQAGLGPRFPAEFYENRGQLPHRLRYDVFI